ncbi:MAG: hypothetical protein A7315_00100 [Candidatus Altiarchaeales archaeon WOR_SM1_79]|nr:MAG: hypothetical protein A7315_00100 [Candidatus Altiarchaeales archaeon WOR_SM1_79]
MIDKGLEDFIEKMIISAEGKYNDAKSIYANFLQPEEMALAERDLLMLQKRRQCRQDSERLQVI